MGASDGRFGYIFILVVLLFWQQQSHSYEVRCPEQSEWSLKASAKCGNVIEYFCLLDDNVKIYTDVCKRNPDITRDITWKKGQKCVFRGNLDGEVCSTERYQPFIFRTDGSSHCAYKKSHCRDEGMIIYKNGSTTSNTQCRCDHTKGFAFVSQTKQSCYCIPSQEDCSCYKKECKNNFKLSSDYNCIFLDSQKDKSECSNLDIRPLVNTDSNNPDIMQMDTDMSSENDMLNVGKKRSFINLSITALFVFTVIVTVVLWKCNEQTMECIRNAFTNEDEKKKVSECQEDVDEEFEKIYNEKIPENLRRFHDNQLKNWISEDKTLVKTNASSKILKLVKEKNCVFIVGRPGSGKSSILRHVALQFVEHNESEDYDIIPVVIEPSNILQYYNESRNQIFVLDDFCGKDTVNNQLVDVWKLDIEKVLDIINQSNSVENDFEARKPKTKILISCNLSVYSSKLFKPLKTHFENFVIELSTVSMTQEERECILKKFFPDAQVEDLKYENSQNKFDFPLLCKLSKGKNTKDRRQLFSDPLTTIQADLKKLETIDNLQFCAVALCTLLNNKFKAQWLKNDYETTDIQVRNAVRGWCDEFNLELTNSTDLKRIQKRFGEQMDWLSESDDTFHYMHDEIFKIAAVFFGETYQPCFINHANSSFIAKKFNFSEENSDGLINLIAGNRNRYFNRLFKDLENGITYSMFQNIQLKTESYRKAFIEYCNKWDFKFKEILGNLKTTAEEENVTSKVLKEKKDKHLLSRQNTFIVSEPPLIDCALQGYEDMVNLLLRMNCDVNERDTSGRSALFVASAEGHIKTVERLVKNKNEKKEENIDSEEYKTNEVNIDLSNNIKRTSLHVACKEGHYDIARYLIQNGADIFVCDANGYSPLHLASVYGSKEIIQLLLNTYKDREKEIEIEKNDNLGQTPIILASSKGEEQTVKLLLHYKAKISATDKKGFTSLLAASMNGYSNTAKVLINNKANICHTDNDGRTALFIACEKGHRKIVKMLIERDKEIIKKCDRHHKSPFYIACAEGKFTIANMLFEGGADINCLDEDEKSPIYAASQRGHEKIVRFLLEKNAKIDKTDSHQNLPLHIACKGGFLEIVKLLHIHQHCLSIKNQWNDTAIDIARKLGHQEIVDYLNEQENKLNSANTEITPVVKSNS